jgi:hypothetical protein
MTNHPPLAEFNPAELQDGLLMRVENANPPNMPYTSSSGR